jgi:hypothetical protein
MNIKTMGAVSVLFIGLGGSGCKLSFVGSNALTPALISQTYTLSYSEQTLQLCGSAAYFSGNTPVVLDPPCSVTFDNQPTSEQTPSITYTQCFNNGDQGTHTWVFTDPNRNIFTITPLVLGGVPSVISRSQGVSVSFSPALASGEQLEVTLSGPYGSSSKTTTFPGQVQGSTLVLSPVVFNGFENGSASLSFQRQIPAVLSSPGKSPATVGTQYQSRIFSVSLSN